MSSEYQADDFYPNLSNDLDLLISTIDAYAGQLERSTERITNERIARELRSIINPYKGLKGGDAS